MKLALLALLALSLSGCTRSDVNSQREFFEPTVRTGKWAQYDRDVKNRKDPQDPSKRALFRETHSGW